ncbi:hypothetical protein EX30DRAFT_340710, partial [Ascodesmis nigricans]
MADSNPASSNIAGYTLADLLPLLLLASLPLLQPPSRLSSLPDLNSHLLRLSLLFGFLDILFLVFGCLTLWFRHGLSHLQSARWLQFIRCADFDVLLRVGVDAIPTLERDEIVDNVLRETQNSRITKNPTGGKLVGILGWMLWLKLLFLRRESGGFWWTVEAVVGMVYWLNWVMNEVLLWMALRGIPMDTVANRDGKHRLAKKQSELEHELSKIGRSSHGEQQQSNTQLEETFRAKYRRPIYWVENTTRVARGLHVWGPLSIICGKTYLANPYLLDLGKLQYITTAPGEWMASFMESIVFTPFGKWSLIAFVISFAVLWVLVVTGKFGGSSTRTDTHPQALSGTTERRTRTLTLEEMFFGALACLTFIAAMPGWLLGGGSLVLLFVAGWLLVIALVIVLLGLVVNCASWVVVPTGGYWMVHQVLYMAVYRRMKWAPRNVMMGMDDVMFVVDVVLCGMVGYWVFGEPLGWDTWRRIINRGTMSYD